MMMVVRDLWTWIRCITKVVDETGKIRREKEKEKAKILKAKAKAKIRKERKADTRKVDTKRQERVQQIRAISSAITVGNMATMLEIVGHRRRKHQKVVEKATRAAKEEKARGNGVAMVQIHWMNPRERQDQRKQLVWTWVALIGTLSLSTRYLILRSHCRRSTIVAVHVSVRCHQVEGGV